MLADVYVAGHLRYLRFLLETLGLGKILTDSNLRLVTFSDLQLPHSLDDRTLWHHCQQEGWVLFTDNRNHDGPNSLEATLANFWRSGHLPVLTLAKKSRFVRDRVYAEQVAMDIADFLVGIQQREFCDRPRIYVPRSRR